MDFGSDQDKPKSTTTNITTTATHHLGGMGGGEPDKRSHSPLSSSVDFQFQTDKLQKSTPGSSDDFEHVGHDPFMSDSSYTSSVGKAPSGAGGDGFLDDILQTGRSQFDSFKTDVGNEFSQMATTAKDFSTDFTSSTNDRISQTRDFMAAERQGFSTAPQSKPQQPPIIEPSRVPEPITVKPPPSPFDDEPAVVPLAVKQPEKIPTTTTTTTAATQPAASNPDPFSFFDSPVKKISKEDNEKFISSEDLLGDFSDARKTPEPATKPSVPAPSAPLLPSTMAEPILSEALHPAPGKIEAKFPEPIVKPIPKPEEKPASPKPTEPVKAAVETAKPRPSAPAPAPPARAQSKKSQMISAEEIFCRYGLDAWFKPDRLHPVVESLIYWRDVKKSGIVFGAGLVILLAISCFSVISVFAYLSLLTLIGTIAFRIYKNILGAIQKTSEGHPFKEYLEFDLTVSQEKAQNVVSVVVAHLNGFVSELRRLFLVDDLVDSIKFGVILWVLTYIGAWFNGMTLVILAFVALFTLPKVYENNKQSIDTYLDLVRSKILEITDKVKAAIPIGKKPQETDKDK